MIEAVTPQQAAAWHFAQATVTSYRQAARVAHVMRVAADSRVLEITKPHALYTAA